MPVIITVEQRQLGALMTRLAAEADGARLKADLAGRLRAAAAPAVNEVKAGAASLRSSSKASPALREISPSGRETLSSLGAAIAAGVGLRIRMSGRATGVTVKASRSGMPRDFFNAPKRINQKSFRHRVFGSDRQVEQVGKPGYFSTPLFRRHVAYRAACKAAMDAMANRIA